MMKIQDSGYLGERSARNQRGDRVAIRGVSNVLLFEQGGEYMGICSITPP